MSRFIPGFAPLGARDDATWDGYSTAASGLLLLAGGVTAALRDQAQLGEVCTALGAVFLGVAVGIWVAPRLHRRATPGLPVELSAPSGPSARPVNGAGSPVPPAGQPADRDRSASLSASPGPEAGATCEIVPPARPARRRWPVPPAPPAQS